MATKKKPATPRACKCSRPAVCVKIGRLFYVYCRNAYCTECPRVSNEKEDAAIKMWNTLVADKEAQK